MACAWLFTGSSLAIVDFVGAPLLATVVPAGTSTTVAVMDASVDHGGPQYHVAASIDGSADWVTLALSLHAVCGGASVAEAVASADGKCTAEGLRGVFPVNLVKVL